MSRQRAAEDPIRAWVRAGPETASASLVERTLAPIPHMRQRRSWWIVFDRVLRPGGALAGIAAAAVVVVVGAALLADLPGPGGVGSTPSPTASRGPTFTLEVTGSPGQGTYVADQSTSLNLCTAAPDGSWRFLYAGGEPFVNLDMLVGADAGQPGFESSVAVELYAGAGYVRFDPAVLRGGDPPGRSVASVVVEDLGTTTRFVVSATTPDRTSGIDGPPVEIALTVTCPS